MRPFNLTSSISKVLGFQAVFKSTFLPTTYRTMSSISTPQPEIDRVLKYWFETGDVPMKWFRGGAAIDTEIRSQFLPLVQQARSSQLNTWTSTPKGTLALLILLDQFSRNLFRGSPESWSKDKMAYEIATEAIAKGEDREVEHIRQAFFYLPLMHDESLISQIAGLALYEGLVSRCDPETQASEFAVASIKSTRSHLETIRRFGRFPSRNKVLGRESTPEEIKYLEEEHAGW